MIPRLSRLLHWAEGYIIILCCSTTIFCFHSERNFDALQDCICLRSKQLVLLRCIHSLRLQRDLDIKTQSWGSRTTVTTNRHIIASSGTKSSKQLCNHVSMYPTSAILLTAAIGLISTANAHIKLSSPVPYGKSTLNNSPLAADGSDFPCKQRPGVYALEGALEQNTMQIGQPQTLAFIGGATHGGGSCQVSITEDKEPTKDSKWSVIHSIEGGCPAATDGNLSGDPESTGTTDFTYKIPDSVKPGQYTLAWTWFNRIGNREMYMDCAPINVVAGSQKRHVPHHGSSVAKRAPALPDMFVANIGNGCSTVETQDLKFPNPGESVQKAGSGPLAPPVCQNGSGGSPASEEPQPPAESSPADSGVEPGEFQETAVVIVNVAPTTTPSSAPTSAPAPSKPAAPVATTTPGSAPAPAPTPASAPAPSAGSSGTNNSSAAGGCTAPGQSVCSPDGSQIGTCDANNRVTFVNVAPGTICKGGYMVAAKRSARFARGHVRRGHSFGRW
jgi:methionine-rich copper-binding protein CopC